MCHFVTPLDGSVDVDEHRRPEVCNQKEGVGKGELPLFLKKRPTKGSSTMVETVENREACAVLLVSMTSRRRGSLQQCPAPRDSILRQTDRMGPHSLHSLKIGISSESYSGKTGPGAVHQGPAVTQNKSTYIGSRFHPQGHKRNNTLEEVRENSTPYQLEMQLSW